LGKKNPVFEDNDILPTQTHDNFDERPITVKVSQSNYLSTANEEIKPKVEYNFE
jgi:hypothetical protein